jgi:hypothetical protein
VPRQIRSPAIPRCKSKMPDGVNHRAFYSGDVLLTPALRCARPLPRGPDRLLAGFPARRVLCSSRRRPKTKNPPCFRMPGFQFWRRPTLARPVAVLPLGLQRFTAVFGMGTGGATALLSPEPRSACAARLWWRRFAPRLVEAVHRTAMAIEVNRRYLTVKEHASSLTSTYRAFENAHFRLRFILRSFGLL